jgi:hypothetical protein
MALTQIPPWLDITPAFFTNAASSGARIGLEKSGQTMNANEAADRLRLGYAQLKAENERAAMSAASSERQANAANALRQTELQSHIAENNSLNTFRSGELADRQAALDLENKKFTSGEVDKSNLMKETSNLFGELSTAATPADQLKTLSKYPNAAHALKAGVLSDFVQKPTQPPASVKLVDEIQKTEQAANEAFSKGDTTAATQLRDRASLLREQGRGSMEEFTGYNDQGLPIYSLKRGPSSSQATVATQSQAQQKLIRYENSVELMNHLDKVLTSGHVGAAGVTGEYLMDRGLSQLVPELANKDRVDARSTLIALREGLSREMADDRGRFSAADREEIMRALPSNGMWESLPDASQRISTVRNIIMQRARNYSQAIGQPAPLWTLSADEIKAQFKAGKIDEKTAINALTRFY